jgi:hypothetical protein
MVLHGDEAHVESHSNLFGEIILDARYGTPSSAVCTERTMARKSFWTPPMELLGDVGHVKSCFGPFGDSVSVSAIKVHGLH